MHESVAVEGLGQQWLIGGEAPAGKIEALSNVETAAVPDALCGYSYGGSMNATDDMRHHQTAESGLRYQELRVTNLVAQGP